MVDTKMGTLMRTVEHPARLLPPQPHPVCQLLEILGISALGGEEERARARLSHCSPEILTTPNEAEPNSVLCG